MRVEGLIFDVGDIFFDATPWCRWLTDELQRHNVDISYEELVEKWEAQLVDVYRGQADYWERFEKLLLAYGLSKNETGQFAQKARDKGKQVQLERKVFDGVSETLANLKSAQLKLAALSDTENSAVKVREILMSLEIDQYVDAVITSVDVGYIKPEKPAYQAAADALGIQLSRCGFVGHDLDELNGAKSAGMFVIAFNSNHETKADVCIKHFPELYEVIAE